MENKIVKIKVRVEERKTKDGKKFYVYQVLNKKTKHYERCKFTQDVKNAPNHSCYMNVDLSKINFDGYAEYPTWWVKEIVSLEEFETSTTNIPDFDDETGETVGN